jgi:gluconokinase
LDWQFYEGDDFHSKANKDKMASGIALTDSDRKPWLAAIRDLLCQVLARREDAVVACSALTDRFAIA